MVHRVRATIIPTGGHVDLDLDAAPAIVRGNLNITEQKKVKGKLVDVVKETVECTHVYTADGKCWHVVETPEDLYSAEPILCYQPGALDKFRGKGIKPKAAEPKEDTKEKSGD